MRRRQFPSLASAVVALAFVVPTSMSQAAAKHFDIGDRVGTIELKKLNGDTALASVDTPTMIVLWASWSPASLVALSDIIRTTPQGGIRWRILPVNVDGPDRSTLDTAAIGNAARQVGWKGEILYDQGYRISDNWGVFAVPTVIAAGMGGIVEDIEHAWTHEIRIGILTKHFGLISDSVPGITFDPASEQCRSHAVFARSLWRNRSYGDAIARLSEALDSCPGMSRDAARLVSWQSTLRDSSAVARAITSARTRNPGDPWVMTAEAALARRRGDCVHAIEFAQNAVAQDSAFTPAWVQLALAAEECGDTTLMTRALAIGSSLYRSDPDLLFLDSRRLATAGDMAIAAAHLRQAVQRRRDQSN